MRKLPVLATVVVAAATLLGTGIANGATSGSSATDYGAQVGYTPPAINWHACTSDQYLAAAGAQCGYLVVPMDYAHPGGTKIRLAVSRLKHKTADSHYLGVMLTNPGGPGGSGLELSLLQGSIANGAGNAYDWIGFDPRGVGSSKPALYCNPNFTHGDRPPYEPTSRAIYRRWEARSKRYAQLCTTTPGHQLFNHVKTVDNVRDMDSLRKALHQPQISYYGFSYGTYLGQVYATMYPHRIRRMVLDSSVDPRRVFYKSNQDQDRAFQKTFDIYFHWLAKYHSVYHVGDTYAAVRKTYLDAIDALNKHAAGGVLGGDELTDDFTSAGYYVYDWESIAQDWSAYVTKHNAKPLITRYQQNFPTTKAFDNGDAIYYGTQCTDAPWPHNQAKLFRDNTFLNQKYNYFTWSNAWFNGPCGFWHYKARTPVNVTGHGVYVPILMIDETYDAATPYPGNLVVRSIFKTASLIEGLNGSTHAGSTYLESACTANTVALYLRTGAVPPRKSGNRADKICPPVQQPDPTADSSTARTQVASGAAAPAALPARLGAMPMP